MNPVPLYSSEQINIPPNLGEILKAYAKEVIRQNPPDIIEFSAQYFEQLSQGYDEAPFEQRDLIQLYSQLSKLDRSEITMDEFKTASEISGLPLEAVEEAARLRFQDDDADGTADWKELSALSLLLKCMTHHFDRLVLLCLMIVPQENSAMAQLLFEIFGSDNNQTIPAQLLGQLFKYIEKYDRTLTKSFIERVEALTNTE